MKPLTRNNIAYNLHLSPHCEEVSYEGSKSVYVFSSELYRKKFSERREETRKHIEEMIRRRYGVKVEAVELSDVYLYSQIEKRGFLIYKNDKEVLCQEDLKFVGRITS